MAKLKTQPKAKTKVKPAEPPKRGRGRPKNPEPPPKARILGRVHDERWELWQHATKLSEATFTDWAGKALDEAAKKVLAKHGLL